MQERRIDIQEREVRRPEIYVQMSALPHDGRIAFGKRRHKMQVRIYDGCGGNTSDEVREEDMQGRAVKDPEIRT